MTVQAKRTFEAEKLARIYDDEIAPCWGVRFGKLLLRDLAVPPRGQVLDVSCGTGYPTIEILRRMTEGSRLIAIDESSAMLDVVRCKVARLGPLGQKSVFFRTETAVPRLSFAAEVYDLVVCNLGLGDMPSAEAAVRDFARVAKPGGEVRCTLPLAGTFEEFLDLCREVLVKHDKHDALDRLDRHVARYPTHEQAERHLAAANLTGEELDAFLTGKKRSHPAVDGVWGGAHAAAHHAASARTRRSRRSDAEPAPEIEGMLAQTCPEICGTSTSRSSRS